MRFKLPFSDRVRVRLFEAVETVDDSYRIVDCGFQYLDDSIDSIAVGGSFHSLSGWTGMRDTSDATDTAETPAEPSATPSPAAEPSGEPAVVS
jgi:hypothetical protein